MNRWVAAALAAVLLVLCPAAGRATGPFGGSVTDLKLSSDRERPRWAATWRGLFRFDGKRWARVEALKERPLSAVLEMRGRVLVVTDHGAILWSDDDGQTWSSEVKGLLGRYGHRVDEVLDVGGDPADPTHLFLGAAGQGPFESRDGGKVWNLLLPGLEEAPPPAFHPKALLPAAGDRPLLMGTDGAGLYAWMGGRWKASGEGLPPNLRVQQLAADPRDPSRVALAARGEGLWLSLDAGRTWARARKGAFGIVDAVAFGTEGKVLAHFPEEGLVVLTEAGPSPLLTPLREAQVFGLEGRTGGGWFGGLAHDGVVRLTSDGAVAGWENQGLEATRVGALARGDRKGTLWSGDTNGVFFSADDGKSWEARDQGLPGASADALLWHKGGLYVGTGGQGVFRWVPERQTWEDRSGGLGTANTIFAFVEDAGRDRLYVGTEGGLLRSDDGGATWTHRDRGLPFGMQTLVAASLVTPGVVWATAAGKIYRSEDAGDSWAALAETGAVIALLPQVVGGEERLWLLDGTRLSYLSGGRVTPAPLVVEGGGRFTCLAAGSGALWVGGPGGLWVLADGEARKAWEGGSVRSLLAGEGSLVVGTDGRGVLTMRVQ